MLPVLVLAFAGAAFAAACASAGDGRGSGGAKAQDPPLRALALAQGKRFGTALDVAALASESDYRRLAGREFSIVTPENAMKWETVEPQQGHYDWSQGDQLLQFASEHRQLVRGHVLVWHNQLPSWLTDGSFTNDELAQLLHKHITDEVSHFRGRIYAWDVVNEALNEDGTLRDSIWLRALGPDYIADAFRWAHEADPHAKLYYNDYNLEFTGPKSNAAYALVQNLKAQGVPIDGVGFQGHLDIKYGFPDLQDNLERFAALGLDVAVTEADVRVNLPATRDELATQASYYKQLTDACLAVRRCVSFTVWGFTDRHSWVPSVFTGEGAATLSDENLDPKPAYFAVRDSLLHRRAS